MLDYQYGDKLPVLDHGYVALVDKMGTDEAIVDAARISYDRKGKSADRGLLRYLMRHRHCYHPSMQVLTIEGWKRWDECGPVETFMVPDPKERTLTAQSLTVDVFDANEEMLTFENDRMSYSVTSDHRMWFRGKYQKRFSVVRAKDMSLWGHFDSSIGYSFIPKNTEPSALGRFIGFILGDGSWSGNGLSFHLRKDRKKKYLQSILSDLDIIATVSPSSTYEDACVFYVKVDDVHNSGVLNYLIPGERSGEKKLKNMPEDFDTILGVLDGLINSDGCRREDRPGQVQYSSVSKHLLRLFETLSSLCGMDAHRTTEYVTAYSNLSRTSLESRKEYHNTECHTGKVYCATTDTGLLMVRGGPDKFGFVCGNTTPFEMAVLKFELKMPIFVARQWIRHRTASINEMSARYTQLPDEMFVPEESDVGIQSKTNKQGRELTDFANDADMACTTILNGNTEAYGHYEELLKQGVSREIARGVLPLNTYTKFIWKIDLHNLMHFLKLRLDPHAQKEIRDFATVIENLVALYFPMTYEAFVDYQKDAYICSRMEIQLINMLNHGAGIDDRLIEHHAKQLGMSSRETASFMEKFSYV